MTLAIFSLLEHQSNQERVQTIQILKNNLCYDKLFELIEEGKSCIDFSEIFTLLKYYNVKYSFGDNIYDKLYQLVKDLKFNAKDNHKKKTKKTIFGTLKLIKQLKSTNFKKKKYDLLIEFLSVCERNEIKWAVQILTGDKEVKELLGEKIETM